MMNEVVDYDPRVFVRDFSLPTGEGRVKVPSVRLTLSREIKERLHKKTIAHNLAPLLNVVDNVYDRAPHLFDEETPPLFFPKIEIHDDRYRNQWRIVALPDEESATILHQQRTEALRAIEDSVGLPTTEWPKVSLEVILATAPVNYPMEAVNALAAVALGRGPYEIPFDLAQFDPDPRP